MARVEVDGGPSFECSPSDTVLRSALRAGLPFPYACNMGSCGNCRFELLEGEVSHVRRDAPAWTERDRKRNRWLGCQAVPASDCRIRVRLDPACAPPVRPSARPARLTEVVPLTHDMSEFAFALEGPDAFRPGQYALLHLAGPAFPRAYSMCNLPGEGEWRFQVKRIPGGAATGLLFDALRPGDAVTIDGPYGTAFLREDAPRDLVLAAGGSGLSPMMSIARAAAVSPGLSGRRVDFFYGGRLPRDVCGESQLCALPGYGARLRYLAAISEAAEGWTGETGFVHEVVRRTLGDALREREVYFAGPSAMAAAMQAMLREAGVPPEQVHFDEFY